MLLGNSVFDEIPSVTTIAGPLIVIAAGLYTLQRERIVLQATASARPAVSVLCR